jgi:hypothetical protein
MELHEARSLARLVNFNSYYLVGFSGLSGLSSAASTFGYYRTLATCASTKMLVLYRADYFNWLNHPVAFLCRINH